MTFIKRILTWLFSDQGRHAGTFVLRVLAGGFIMSHGLTKIRHFSTMSESFMDPIGLWPGFSLALIIFAEFFCGLLLVLGLLTRLATIPLIIGMAVAAFVAHPGSFSEAEMALLYLVVFVSLFFMGAGKFSLDHLIARRINR